MTGDYNFGTTIYYNWEQGLIYGCNLYFEYKNRCNYTSQHINQVNPDKCDTKAYNVPYIGQPIA